MVSRTVTQRGKSWEATVRHEGRRERRSFPDHNTAEAWAAQTEADLLTGKKEGLMETTPRPKLFGDAVEAVMKHRWSGTKSERTHELNSEALLNWFGLRRDLNTIDAGLVDKFVMHLRESGNANATVNRKLSCLSVILRFAYKRGWLDRLVEIERRSEPLTRISYYSPEEQRVIIDSFISNDANAYANLFAFLCDTGLRMGEALSLTYPDIRPLPSSPGGHAVFVHEGKQAVSPPRMIPLTRRAYRAVGNSSGGEGPFTHLTKRGCRTAWDKLRKNLGRSAEPDFIWHTCRHTFCSLLIQRGLGLTVVKKLAGHRDINTTVRYSHLSPLDSVDAIAALDADE
jgi:integrase